MTQQLTRTRIVATGARRAFAELLALEGSGDADFSQ
jgi:hypothetical protein